MIFRFNSLIFGGVYNTCPLFCSPVPLIPSRPERPQAAMRATLWFCVLRWPCVKSTKWLVPAVGFWNLDGSLMIHRIRGRDPPMMRSHYWKNGGPTYFSSKCRMKGLIVAGSRPGMIYEWFINFAKLYMEVIILNSTFQCDTVDGRYPAPVPDSFASITMGFRSVF